VGFEETERHDAVVRDRTLADMLSPESVAFEPFRVLRSKLHAATGPEGPGSLGLVGATAGEGATTIAIGLAGALAEEAGRKVLLVEADLREPTIASRLGLEETPGLAAWLSENGDEPPAVCHVEPWGFALLPAGPGPARAGERLGSDRMARLLAAARASFDTVLVDCPPLSPWADSVALHEHLDGVLVVVRARYADGDTVKEAVGHLRPDRVRGLVFNDHREVLTRLRRRRKSRRR
jgi:Mrp family chromosome partitioning ATPase